MGMGWDEKNIYIQSVVRGCLGAVGFYEWNYESISQWNESRANDNKATHNHNNIAKNNWILAIEQSYSLTALT